MEILILRILDKPHCTSTHNTATAREEDSELIPAKDAIISYRNTWREVRMGNHLHEHGTNDPMIECGCDGCEGEECES